MCRFPDVSGASEVYKHTASVPEGECHLEREGNDPGVHVCTPS